MKIALISIGRLKSGPESALCLDYITRAQRLSRTLGFDGPELIELELKHGRAQTSSLLLKEQEKSLFLERIKPSDVVIACDERGQALTSRMIGQKIQSYALKSCSRLVFVIGGADGLDQAMRERADLLLAFGPQTWPHALVRVMLAEQIYRALSLIAGLPYHRD